MKTKFYLKSLLGTSFMVVGMLSAQAQVLSFTNANSKLPNNAVNYRSGCAVTVVDVNNDGLDDIVRLNQSNEINLEIQGIGGTYTNYFLGAFTGGKAWAMTTADLDHNGYKDVIAGFGSAGSVAMISYTGGSYTATISNLQGGNYFWQNITVGDFNNDGWEDIFGCDDVNWSKLFINNQDGTFRRLANALQTKTIELGTTNLTVQTNLSFPAGQQVYVAYNGENYMTGNVVSYNAGSGALVVDVTSIVGSGTFDSWSVDKNTLINFITNPGNFAGTSDPNNSGNYGTIWTDFDSDGDMDFYIAKCRQSSQVPTDIRRINQLFINDGTYKFTENAAAKGIAVGWQSWTASFGDIDNDGDFDLAVINNDHSSQIFENTGNGNYVELVASNVSTSDIYPMESVFEDFDNDGFIDLFITGDDDYIYYKNNGDKTFSRVNGLLSGNGIMSFATGDLNHDGFIDIYASLGQIYNNSSNTYDDIMYLNDGNSINHFISFDLEGTVSNVNALGANVAIYGPWGVQRREVRSGESYGTCNTFGLHFGLGIYQKVDSAIISWPSGITQQLYNLTANQFITVVENECVIADNFLGGTLAICNGLATTINAPSGYASYLWNTGATTPSISAATPTAYSVTVTDANGCSNTSPFVTLAVNPIQTPIILSAGDLSFCQGGSVVLTSSSGASYLWSNGSTTQSITITETGNYTVDVEGACETFTSNGTAVDVMPAPAPQANGGTVNGSGTVNLTASGNSLTWYSDAAGTNAVGTGALYTTPVISSNTTYYVQDTYTYGGGISYNGLAHHTGTSDYSSNTINASLIFDAYEAFTLKTVKVYTDTPGNRLIVLTDANGTVLQSAMVNIPMDSAVISLNFNVPVGTDLKLGTDGNQNTSALGFVGPRLKRAQGAAVTYPYTINNLISITNSTQGLNVFYYFFNWEVERIGTTCVSELVPVVAEVLVTGIANANNSESIQLYPNPAAERVSISSAKAINSTITVSFIDVAGRAAQVVSYNSLSANAQQSIDISKLAKGIYFVKINSANSEIIEKLVIQ